MGHRKLAELAMDYLKISASTAQLERLFPNWAFVHSDRLSPETSKKLLNTYFTLRSSEEIIDEEPDDIDISDDQNSAL